MTVLNVLQHPISLVRSKRKTIGLHVKEQRIEIRAPAHVPIDELTDFIYSKQDWLAKVLKQQAEHNAEKPDFSNSTHIPYMGKEIAITLTVDSRFGWREQEDKIQLFAKSNEKEQVHSLIADYYLTKAKYVLHNKTIDLVTTLNWRSKLTDIRFKRTKTKWGHCTATGRIQYNWLILMAPESVIDYLIAHEVSHLIHLNHSAQFWQQVQEIHPSYKRDRQWLADHGHTLTL